MKVSPTDCSALILTKTAQRCGFLIFQGKNHIKVKSKKGAFITTIPRHNKIKKEVAIGIIKQFQKHNCNCDIQY